MAGRPHMVDSYLGFDEMQTFGGDLSLADVWWLEEDR